MIVCRSEEGWRFLPGGTRESGETLVDLVQRGLLEEAGARATGGVQLFAAHVVEVLTLPAGNAADYIGVRDPLHADIVRLAVAMELI